MIDVSKSSNPYGIVNTESINEKRSEHIAQPIINQSINQNANYLIRQSINEQNLLLMTEVINKIIINGLAESNPLGIVSTELSNESKAESII